MTVRAYAKINLGLRILHKRPDGYHNIETLFHQINQYDEINLQLHENAIRLTTVHASLPTDHNNLCVKAAHLLRDITGVQEGAEIILTKHIPVGGGLGGGSSDAAATLVTLTSLWNLDLATHELETLGLTLGSDVPFFIRGGSAYGTGRGEKLQPVSLRLPYWIIVVTPPFHVSTATAYKNLGRDDHPVPLKGIDAILLEHLHDPEYLRSHLENDFEPVIFSLHPEIRTLRDEMIRLGAELALLSGSGSSVFGLTKSEETAQRIAGAFESSGTVSLTKPFFVPERNATT